MSMHNYIVAYLQPFVEQSRYVPISPQELFQIMYSPSHVVCHVCSIGFMSTCGRIIHSEGMLCITFLSIIIIMHNNNYA